MLKDKLMADYKEALRLKDELRVGVIRMIRAAIKNAEIDKQSELNDEDVVRVIQSEIRKEREALEAFEQGGREDLAEETRRKLEILESYLPEMLSEDEIRNMAQEAIEEAGALSPRDMGKVMSILMPKVKGRADGRIVSGIVRELLEAKIASEQTDSH